MNRIEHAVCHIARFTLEARTALSIGTGGPDGVFDHPIVRDANGLPSIPGTSLAGVLRHLMSADGNETSVNDLFGYQRKGDGAASRLEVATCVLQDKRGCPVEGLLRDSDENRLKNDPVLKAARATLDDPLFRDRVRITHRGVADHRGKFDRGLLAAGHRFSGELRLWSKSKDDPDWERILGLLADPRLRLGGATRAGLGAMTLASLHTLSLDLRECSDSEQLRGLKPGLGDLAEMLSIDPGEHASTRSGTKTLSLTLKPRDFWLIGDKGEPIARHGKDPDRVPKREPVLHWQNGEAMPELRLALLPGSSVKGALSHRTAFHWNALNRRFADDLDPEALANWDKSEHCPGVQAIFGYAKDRDHAADRGREGAGQAGQIIVEDGHVQVSATQVQTMIHNSLDRFTGGVRDRILFSEELIFQQEIKLHITLLPGILSIEPTARRALARAILDLCQGRLALGAGTTKGHGAFTAAPDDATHAWLAEQGEPVEQPVPQEDPA